MSNDDFKNLYEAKCVEFDELNEQFNEYQGTYFSYGSRSAE